MVASSASSERGFSAEMFIHSKSRIRLSDAKVSKLLFIKFNSSTLSGYAAEKPEDDEAEIVDRNGCRTG